MSEPTPRNPRHRNVARLILLALVAGGGFMAGWLWPKDDLSFEPAAAEIAAEPAKVPVLQVPLPPALGRQDLIGAAARAADAFANGQPGDDSALIGRRFEIRLPFGCNGPLPDDSTAPLRWSYDSKREVLRLTARPQVWTDAPWAHALAPGRTAEAIEGFWVSRPWSLSDDCPSPPPFTPEAAYAVPSEEWLGLAHYFSPSSSRVQQRNGKPYEATEKVKADALDTTQGFQLVLRGRVEELAEGQPARCHAPSIHARPICLVAVSIDNVAFRNPATGRTIAEWRT